MTGLASRCVLLFLIAISPSLVSASSVSLEAGIAALDDIDFPDASFGLSYQAEVSDRFTAELGVFLWNANQKKLRDDEQDINYSISGPWASYRGYGKASIAFLYSVYRKPKGLVFQLGSGIGSQHQFVLDEFDNRRSRFETRLDLIAKIHKPISERFALFGRVSTDVHLPTMIPDATIMNAGMQYRFE